MARQRSRPTISGRIIEQRDQVLIGRLSFDSTAFSTFAAGGSRRTVPYALNAAR